MRTWLAVRGGAAQVFGIVLVLIGFVPVLLFSVAALMPSADAAAVFGLLPEVPSTWVSTSHSWLRAHLIFWAPHPGLLYALPGLALMWLGAWVVRGTQPVFDADQARRDDARRRAPLYGAERIEPTLE
jgi:hypothetical protein